MYSSVPSPNQKFRLSEEHEKLPSSRNELEEAVSCGRARNPAWIETECLSNWDQDLVGAAGSVFPPECLRMLSQHHAGSCWCVPELCLGTAKHAAFLEPF